MAETKIPERIGKYRITSVIGKGGMGNVYKALQEPLNREVALKILPEEFSRNEEFAQRFMTEAKAVSTLEHQNIVGIYDYGMEGRQQYIAMRYIEGRNLAERLYREKRLGAAAALDVTRQICRALKYAHERRVLHRDIKPQNILLDGEGRVFVTDFGIAKIYSQTGLTRTGVVVGTPEYMSPEQAEGLELDPQTDIYSMGVVLFEMLTGAPPFTGDNPLAIAYKHVNVQPPGLSERIKDPPKHLELVVLKALKKDRGQRYRSIDEFLEDLDRTVISGDVKTRDMAVVSGIKREKTFHDDKRVVDRRSSDRRRETRRGYLRRVHDAGGRRRGVFAALVGVIALLCALLAYTLWFRPAAGAPAGLAPAVKKFVGDGFPERAFDENNGTCWRLGGTAPGFTVHFTRKKPVNRIDIVSGDNSGQDTFGRSGRPKKVLFVFNGRTEFEVALEDTPERQVIVVPELMQAKEVTVRAVESYPGLENREACISEVRFWHSPVH